MYNISRSDEVLTVKTSSQLENIDRIVDEVSHFVASMGGYNTASLIQVVRELVLNAMEHGNKNSIEKSVEVEVTQLEQNRISLKVTDEGEGISSELFPVKKELDSGSERSRGLVLINSLVDEFKIGDNPCTLLVYMTLPKQFDWGVVRTAEKTVIEPTRDISAAVLEGLRKLLFEWLDSDVPACELSLKHANSLDSVSLSLLISFSVYLKKSDKEEGFVISNVSPDLRILFQMTQLGRLFRIEDAHE